jgi:hypothetical protein
MRWHLAPLMFVATLAASCALAQSPLQCTKEQAQRAEDGIDGISTWAQVYEAFESFHQCDDGAIAEGYDDKIVGLLVSQWNTVNDLYELTRTHSEFEIFVLKHIDTLMSPAQGRAIIESARNHCPTDVKELCVRLQQKAEHPDE